jgi:hypothetical protein
VSYLRKAYATVGKDSEEVWGKEVERGTERATYQVDYLEARAGKLQASRWPDKSQKVKRRREKGCRELLKGGGGVRGQRLRKALQIRNKREDS